MAEPCALPAQQPHAAHAKGDSSNQTLVKIETRGGSPPFTRVSSSNIRAKNPWSRRAVAQYDLLRRPRSVSHDDQCPEPEEHFEIGEHGLRTGADHRCFSDSSMPAMRRSHDPQPGSAAVAGGRAGIRGRQITAAPS